MAKKKTVNSKINKKPSAKSSKKTAKKVDQKNTAPKKKGPVKKKEDLMCFLTNACVSYYGLPDDAYELNTLRNYRDSYLRSSNDGENLIQTYYQVAPIIVQKLNNDKQAINIYAYIFNQIKKACFEIEQNQLERAKTTYIDLVTFLKEKYRIN
jgi:hypothetical protein